MVEVAPGTIVVYSDIACPWSHVAIHRLHTTRRRLGLEGEVLFDIHAFPLEVVNRRATPKTVLDAEIPVAGALEPDAGWQMWQRWDYDYPVTTLPAMEAVHVAKEQGLACSEALDSALRRALFGSSRNISLIHEILEVAAGCDGLDAEEVARGLDDGRGRPALARDREVSLAGTIHGSPHLFLADGTQSHNPGIELHWEGDHGRGFPVVDHDDPTVYEHLLKTAASTREGAF